jgi:hypothetical protein
MKVSGVRGAKLAGFLSSATSYRFGATGLIMASFSFGTATARRGAALDGLLVSSLGLRIVPPDAAVSMPWQIHVVRLCNIK